MILKLKYKAALNVRATDPRCCGTCAFLKYDGEGLAICLRPNGPEFNVSEREYDYTVCDMWRSHLHNPLPENSNL